MESVSPILDGDLLRAFVAFATTLNFTHAARSVGLSQPALFERVQRLSSLVGPLYERVGRQITLTDRGRRVAAHGRDMIDLAASFARDLAGEPAQESVTLAAGEGAFLYLLGPAISRAVADGVALRLLTLGAPATCDAVLAGDAHLGVGVIDLVPRGLVARDVKRTPLAVALPRAHPLARRRAIRLRDLAGERLILPPPGRSHRELVGRAISKLGHRVDPPIEADGWPLMLQFTSLGLGVAVVNGVCVPPRGVVLRPVPELGSVCYRLVTRRGAPASRAADRLAERILALAR